MVFVIVLMNERDIIYLLALAMRVGDAGTNDDEVETITPVVILRLVDVPVTLPSCDKGMREVLVDVKEEVIVVNDSDPGA